MVKASSPEILFEDDDVLVVNKPAPMVCHSAARPGHTSLAEWIRRVGVAAPLRGAPGCTAHRAVAAPTFVVKRLPVRMINRLDRETSGLVIVAKNERAAKNLGKQVLRREIQKEYIAICWGEFAEPRGVIDTPIGMTSDSVVYTKRVIDPAGKPSVTEFEVVTAIAKRDHGTGRFSVVRLRPRTGRAHQLRVHLSSSGHPIVGDKIYGPDEKLYLEFIKYGVTDSMLARLLMPRHALHAEFVGFEHPRTQQPVHFRAPLPEDMARFIEEHR
jgi:23S rRNA pseudouridine1911/1915/1917 synthase